MLVRILGEVFVGVLVAGLLTAFVVGALTRLGYPTGPWLGVTLSCVAIAGCVIAGERKHRRRNARQSP
jgi:peptidoglycan/LPS O-acetylase OafA/YrhL